MVYRPRTIPRRRIPTVREARVGTQSPLTRFLALGPSSWYDARDITSTGQQTLVNRVGVGEATFGSTSGSDFNDPARLPHDGTNYVWLPGTASNNLSVPKDGGWAGTMHVTATLVDNTTATFTTTASPILIGDTMLAAGRYRRFDVRDTDGAGALRVTINLATETLSQSSWTATTGQTVTVNRSASDLRTAVMVRPIAMFDGVDDYLQLPATDLPTITATAGQYSALVTVRRHALDPDYSMLWSAEGLTNHGPRLYIDINAQTLNFWFGGASDNLFFGLAPGSAPINSSLWVAGFSCNNGTATLYSSATGTFASLDYTSAGAITYASAPRIMSTAHVVDYTVPAELHSVVNYAGRAITPQEMADASTFLLGTYT